MDFILSYNCWYSFILNVFFKIKTMLTNNSHGFWSYPMAPSSEATLGLPFVTGAFNPSVEWARGKVAGPSLPFQRIGILDTCGIDP